MALIDTMQLYFHNTLSGEVEKFTPITNGKVGMYHCGPTVYGRAHIGNMRPYVFADVLRRLFTYQDFAVTQVINITDVGHLTDDADDGEDKVERKAKEANQTADTLTKQYTKIFFDDLDLLHVDRSKIIFPKATGHINEQIEMIKQLEAKGVTYKTTDGIYFDTSMFDAYGALGNVSIDEDGKRRIAENKEKRHSADFALWKFSKPTEKRQQEWDSPWGVGFPGWHIECSAMSQKYLGDTFDIHTGGVDHIPVHHNNEIAQSETANEKPQANYWLHVNHITIDGEKISKSLGNDIYLSDLEEKHISPLAYRYWLLTADYRTLVNFTWDAVTAAKQAYEKLVHQLAKLPVGGAINERYKQMFINAVNDDVNTAKGIALIWELLKDTSVSGADKRATILDFDNVLGLNLDATVQLAQQFVIAADVPDHVQKLVDDREAARAAKEFTKADALREMIADEGFDVQDSSEGPIVTPR